MTDPVLRALTQGAYDLQKVRISVGNRLCQAFYQAHGVEPGESPDVELDEKEKKLLDEIRRDFKRLTDGLVRLPMKRKFEPTKFIGSYAILMMVQAYEETLRAEETAMKAIADLVCEAPIWTAFLKGVRGCGPTMAAVLLSRLDIRKAEYPSQFWAFAGLDVAPDGRGRSRRKEHLVDREYTDRNGEVTMRKSITFDPWLKTKLYVLAGCFLKAGGKYKDIYDGYKNRLKSHPNWIEKTDGHRHNAAMRYMTKVFLQDLYNAWRPLEGLPVAPTYAEAKLGIKHHRAA